MCAIDGHGRELQRPQADQHLGQQVRELRVEPDLARVPAAAGPHHLGEHGGDVLVGAVLQQPREEDVAGLEQGEVVLVLDLAGREQPRGLEVEQRGRDDEEFGGLVEVPLRSASPDVGQEVVDDRVQGQDRDIETVLGDEGEEQVEGALELLEPHREGACGGGHGLGGAGVGGRRTGVGARLGRHRPGLPGRHVDHAGHRTGRSGSARSATRGAIPSGRFSARPIYRHIATLRTLTCSDV